MPDLRSKILPLALTWTAVWPIITLLLVATEGLMGSWPLPIQTLSITAIMVPAMSLMVSPLIVKLDARLRQKDQGTNAIDACP